MTAQLCVHVCVHYLTEFKTILQQEQLSDIDIQEYLPACILIQRKQKILNRIAQGNKESQKHVLLADCCALSQNEPNLILPGSSLRTINSGNCLQMLLNSELLHFFAKDGGYLVSPGWLSRWKSNLKDWGFDQSTAQQFFRESFTRIVMLDTHTDVQSKVNLECFSKYLGLPTEIIPVGLDHFRYRSLMVINQWKSKQETIQMTSTINEANEQVANYSLAFDLVSNLTRMMNENDALKEIVHIFEMLFSPKKVNCISIIDNKIKTQIPNNSSSYKSERLFEWAHTSKDPFLINKAKNGFFLRISHLSETLGAAGIEQVAFPKYLDKYLNMGAGIAPLFGLALSKARTYQKLEEDEALLQQMASTDFLTGLFNRRYFISASESELNRAKRYGNSLSAILLDIDYFKQINDTFGHDIGDKILIEFSRLLTSSLRNSDIPARLGGDEFIILLPETGLQRAAILSERLRIKIKDFELSLESGPIKISSSIGVADVDETCLTIEELLHRCDQALYKAKSLGRDKVVAWSSNNLSAIHEKAAK